MFDMLDRAIIPTTILLGALAPTGCGILQSERPGEEIVESLPAPAKTVVDLATLQLPSNQRDWRPEFRVLPFAELSDHGATVRHVRGCRWRTGDDFDVHHHDWTFRWDDVIATDFVVVPFKGAEALAHTMLSFGLRDGRWLVLSVEARLEAGESYSPIRGAARQYDLIYLLGDESDLLGLRAEMRRDDVYIFRSRATPEQSAKLLREVLERTNQLLKEPEFYDSLTNNCATNIADHIETMIDGELSSDWRLRLPGYSDTLAYDLELIDTSLPLEQIREQAFSSVKIRQYLGEPNFSTLIRQKR